MKNANISAIGSTLTLSTDYDGNYLTAVAVEIDGFAGHGSGHVVEADFLHFSNCLDELARTRKGQASFASISSEIQLTLKAVDTLGHLSASGQLLQRSYGSSSSDLKEQTLSFNFDFDPCEIEAFALYVREVLQRI